MIFFVDSEKDNKSILILFPKTNQTGIADFYNITLD